MGCVCALLVLFVLFFTTAAVQHSLPKKSRPAVSFSVCCPFATSTRDRILPAHSPNIRCLDATPALSASISLFVGLSRFAATSWNFCRDFDDDEEQNDEAHSHAASCLIDHGIVDQRSPTFFVFGISIRHFVETLQSETGVASSHLGLFLKFWTTVKYNNANADEPITQNKQITQNTNAKCTANAMQRKERERAEWQFNQSINQSMIKSKQCTFQ